MLRLEHKCAPMDVHMPPFADDRSVEEVPGVELHSGLGRAHVEGTATDRIDDTGGMRERRSLPVDYPVVIVAAAETNLLVRCRDPRTDRRRSPEVEWGPRDGRDFASRDEVESTGVNDDAFISTTWPRMSPCPSPRRFQ